MIDGQIQRIVFRRFPDGVPHPFLPSSERFTILTSFDLSSIFYAGAVEEHQAAALASACAEMPRLRALKGWPVYCPIGDDNPQVEPLINPLKL